MLVWVSGIALYNGYYQHDPAMADFVYVSDSEEVAAELCNERIAELAAEDVSEEELPLAA